MDGSASVGDHLVADLSLVNDRKAVEGHPLNY